MNRLQPRADARANRERVISAARELFGEHGTGAEMREIAERAGVAVGTIYRNYPTKGDLIRAVVEDAIADATLEAAAAEALADPVAGLTSLLESSIGMAERYGWLAEAFLSGQLADPQHEAMMLKEHKFDLAARFQRLVERALATGVIAKHLDADVVAGLLSSAAAPWACLPLLSSRTPAELARTIVTTLLGETAGPQPGATAAP